MHIKSFNTALIVIMAVCSGCAISNPTKHSSPVYLKFTCENLENFISRKGEYRIPIAFRNKRADTIQLYWVNYSGEEELKAVVRAGEQWSVDTYLTHPWVVRDSSQKCIAIYHTRSSFTVDIR